MTHRILLAALFALTGLGALSAQEAADAKPLTIFVAGDSTAAPSSDERQVGWATLLDSYFDPAAAVVDNRARGGRSSRTFITEGHWAALIADVKPGDIVLIQFGHNDGGAINREPPGSDRPLRARGSLPGLGNESEEIDNAVTGLREVVRSYGWYLRRMIADTRARNATPIVLSLTVRNIWRDGRIERGAGMYREWAYQVAKAENAPFIDVTNLAADALEPLGEDAVSALYPKDHTHMGREAALTHAEAVVAGLKSLRPSPVEGTLSDKGAAVARDELTWLNLPRPADPRLPTLFLIGDSTVRNGRGDGAGGQWGWGDRIDDYFNPLELNVVNRAVGGLSSRTYRTGGHWEKVLSMIKPGDFVLMQFGHNDGAPLNDDQRARGTIKGYGDESEAIDNLLTGKPEVVRSYGWYLRQYVEETRAAGATPIICSLVPRKKWDEDGKIARSRDSYADWARAVAEQTNAPFIDLHELVAVRYDELGPENVDPLFGDAHTHTSAAGAALNAECVIRGLNALRPNPLAPYYRVRGDFEQPVTFAFAEGFSAAFRVDAGQRYSPLSGYGYDLDTVKGEPSAPFYFSVAAREGNYRLTARFGAADRATSNTVKAETRRLMLENVDTQPGAFVERAFVVNVRHDRLTPPELHAPGGSAVALNDREIGKLHWDDKLTIEFNGDAPGLVSLQVEALDCPTIYLVGDSTVTDQPDEPAASWGQMLPRFFQPVVAVANHAESGETMKSFISGLRFAKVLERMKAGDYLFIQFAHNDQKKQWPQTYAEADTTYKAYLNVFIEEARLRGAIPVLVTSMQRRRFDDKGKIVSTLEGYPDAMRAVAKAQRVALIDLQRMSVALYEALGPDQAPQAFSANGKDATHHNNYGAYQLAQCVAHGIRAAKLPLAQFLVPSFRGYDPKRPDEVDTFDLAASPNWSDQAPRGN